MWQQLESGRVVHRFEWVVLVATLALIPVLAIETEASSNGWQNAMAMNWIIWAVFLAELGFILVVAPRKGAALRAHWLDAAIVVLTVPAFDAFLSSLRFARLARLLRFLRLTAILLEVAIENVYSCLVQLGRTHVRPGLAQETTEHHANATRLVDVSLENLHQPSKSATT